MVRFDPSQPIHSQFEMQQKSNISNKNKKDKTKKVTEILETKKSEETDVPSVSKDVFYQVKGNLKDSLHETKQVSLLSMFGQKNENGKSVSLLDLNLVQDSTFKFKVFLLIYPSSKANINKYFITKW